MEDQDIHAFIQWFQANGGYLDRKVMGITTFPDSGRGAIALSDIPAEHTLFTLPRTLTLSTRTSPLPALFGLEAWHAHRLHKGWVGLILCMMWEDAWAHAFESHAADGGGIQDLPDSVGNVQTKSCRWGPYMRTLPTTFDTPMFWSAEELEELRGTSVIDKIGREDAERAYSEQLVPAINTSPALFPPSHHEKWYTLEAYHRAGSRILSRSFTVTRWTHDGELVEEDEGEERDSNTGAGGSEAEEDEDPRIDTSMESSMHVDSAHPSPPSPENPIEDPEEDEDDPSDVAMVPMADVLNARWGSENAKLFYESSELRMVTTKIIRRGEQIFNTYGDLPNSDLLRQYGHVDLVPLPSSSSAPDGNADVRMEIDGDVNTILHLGNPSDVVEIRADLVVHVIQTGSKAKDIHARIECWLDEGQDDVFALSLSGLDSDLSSMLPPTLVSFIRLLTLSEFDFESARSKGKLPKGKLKKDDIKGNKDLLGILNTVFEKREEMYSGGSAEADEHLLSLPGTLGRRQRHAVVVRLGEKRILRNIRQKLRVELSVANDQTYDTRANKGGVNNETEAVGGKKRAVKGILVEGNWGRKRPRKG